MEGSISLSSRDILPFSFPLAKKGRYALFFWVCWGRGSRSILTATLKAEEYAISSTAPTIKFVRETDTLWNTRFK
jgi:hypothetical protein